MNTNLKPSSQFNSLFNKKVSVLVIDDDIEIGEIITNDLFLSPLFSFKFVSKLKDAHDLIRSSKTPWNCWIVDINLKSSLDGSSLLDTYPQFSFAVIFSGASTLETATQALKKGAIAAFSKSPAMLFSSDAFYNEVCRVSALSFVLKGQQITHIEIFRPLLEHFITSVDEWAEHVNVTTRHLQRICGLYIPIAPRLILQFYHAMYFGLRISSFTEQFDAPTPEDSHILKNVDFYHSCVDAIISKSDTIFNKVYF
jgi:ActR/RegA family two-component response regulator